jgi:thiamine biosynthesis protein ThiS
MIKINYNDTEIFIAENSNLHDFLKIHETKNIFCIALNKKFIPRHQYSKTILYENDVLQIILPMQGG